MTYVRYVLYGMYMPDVKVYIRAENYEKWTNIHNKSEWINTLLVNSDNTSEYGKKRDIGGEDFVTVLSETLDPFEQFLKDYSLPGTKPPHPKYGYPCCHQPKPCKHWTFNDLDGNWVNQLTNEVKEA